MCMGGLPARRNGHWRGVCEEQGRGVWCLGGARTRGLVFGRSRDEGFARVQAPAGVGSPLSKL
jgi:hypothetical protein